MKETGVRNGAYGADKFGFKDLAGVHWNLTAAPLYEHAIRNGEATIVAGGALCAETGHHTGRSPKDKHTVVDALTENTVWWDGNRKLSKEHFDNLLADFLAHAKGKTLFAQDLYGGADPKYRIKARVFTELAWHSLFIRQLLIRPERAELASYVPDMTIVDMPSFKPDAKRHGGRDGSDTMVAIDFTRKIVLIGGSSYAGEMKKSVFTTLELLSAGARRDADALLGQCRQGRRQRAVLRPVRHRQDDAVGRSEPHPDRRRRDRLVAGGHLQFRGRLLRQDASSSRPRPSRRSGTPPTASAPCWRTWCSIRRPAFRITTATRRPRTPARPIRSISSRARRAPALAGHPKNIIFLTADAFGVMPPIAKLTPAQAMYHFLSGYTAKVAGTEKGLVGVEPEFSTCFGAPFLPRPPAEYGRLLRDYIAKHKVDCWLVNSGWTGGIYGVGRRMPIKVTRALVTGALDGSLAQRRATAPIPISASRCRPRCRASSRTSSIRRRPGRTKPRSTRPRASWSACSRRTSPNTRSTVDADVRAAAPEVRLAAE